MRRTSALVSSVAVVAVLAAALAGCAASPDDASACTPLLSSGDASSLIKATGEVGTKPKVDVPAPLVVKKPQRSVLENGSGLVAQKGMTADYDAVLLDGETGQEIDATAYNGTARLTRTGNGDAISDALACTQRGSRIAVVSTLKESGLAQSAATAVDLARTIVLVIDVKAVYLGKADGLNQLPLDGMPVVATAPDGTVGISIPFGIDAPSASKTATIKAGGGAVVHDGDQAVIQLASWTWPAAGETLTLKSSTWEPGKAPAVVPVSDVAKQSGGLPSEIYHALKGAKVGSQLLLVVVPDAAAGSTQTMIYVIDVLGIQAPADSAK